MESRSYEEEGSVDGVDAFERGRRLLMKMEDALGLIFEANIKPVSPKDLSAYYARVGVLKGGLEDILGGIEGSTPLLAEVQHLLSIQDAEDAYRYYMAKLKNKKFGL